MGIPPSVLTRAFLAVMLALSLSGCVSSVLDMENRAERPIPPRLLSEMRRNGMSASDPILIRMFKQESELEVWKRGKSGRFTLLKSYPMCRWSGRLGPKMREGDRQAPEGFYHVSAGMLNPNSSYYLSFNLGYPNRLEKALGYTGNALMVHGACSSSGCYALTDEGVSEIYALARDALRGGQQAFQVQIYPFRMSATNMAKYRNDENYGFWADLKRGHDIFAVTRRQPQVSYCDGRYLFDANFKNGEPEDPLAACPSAAEDLLPMVAVRSQADEIAIEQLVATDSAPAPHAYVDGGMHPVFRKILREEGPDGLSRRTSTDEVPISRPQAALADPHNANEE